MSTIKVRLLNDGGYEDELTNLDFDTVFHAKEYEPNGKVLGCDIKADDLRSHGAVFAEDNNVVDAHGYVYFTLGLGKFLRTTEYEVVE